MLVTRDSVRMADHSETNSPDEYFLTCWSRALYVHVAFPKKSLYASRATIPPISHDSR